MTKHQSKPQGYIHDIALQSADIALRSDIAPAIKTEYKKTMLFFSKVPTKKVGEASDINKGFVFCDIYWLYPATRAISDI